MQDQGKISIPSGITVLCGLLYAGAVWFLLCNYPLDRLDFLEVSNSVDVKMQGRSFWIDRLGCQVECLVWFISSVLY